MDVGLFEVPQDDLPSECTIVDFVYRLVVAGRRFRIRGVVRSNNIMLALYYVEDE